MAPPNKVGSHITIDRLPPGEGLGRSWTEVMMCGPLGPRGSKLKHCHARMWYSPKKMQECDIYFSFMELIILPWLPLPSKKKSYFRGWLDKHITHQGTSEKGWKWMEKILSRFLLLWVFSSVSIYLQDPVSGDEVSRPFCGNSFSSRMISICGI